MANLENWPRCQRLYPGWRPVLTCSCLGLNLRAHWGLAPIHRWFWVCHQGLRHWTVLFAASAHARLNAGPRRDLVCPLNFCWHPVLTCWRLGLHRRAHWGLAPIHRWFWVCRQGLRHWTVLFPASAHARLNAGPRRDLVCPLNFCWAVWPAKYQPCWLFVHHGYCCC